MNQMDKNERLNGARVEAFAGVEILRRFYGVAQLPLALTISEKEKLTLSAITWILAYDK